MFGFNRLCNIGNNVSAFQLCGKLAPVTFYVLAHVLRLLFGLSVFNLVFGLTKVSTQYMCVHCIT